MDARLPHPNNLRAGFSEALLRDLYFTERLTLGQVASRLGVAATTISRRFTDVGIRPRSRGPIPNRRGAGATARSGAWTADLAWVVGLIATDGNLSSNGRTVSVTSKDVDLLESVRRCMQLTNVIAPTSGGYGRAYRLQWTSRPFHVWLRSIGLTPAKSLTIGRLDVPDEYFADFLRGCVDGDGSIVTYVDRYNTPKNPAYVYDRLFVSLASASSEFVEWIRQTTRRLRGVSGHLTVWAAEGRTRMWRLRYGKKDSVTLLRWMYYAPDVVALRRKREHAERALAAATWYRRSLSGVDFRERAGVSELAYDADSKSVARKGVWVRLPPPAPPSLS